MSLKPPVTAILRTKDGVSIFVNHQQAGTVRLRPEEEADFVRIFGEESPVGEVIARHGTAKRRDSSPGGNAVVVGDFTLPCISEIAECILRDWKNVSPYAEPYLAAMETLHTVQQSYGPDSGKTVVFYFLANATTYNGIYAGMNKALLRAHCEMTLLKEERTLVKSVSHRLEETNNV